MKEEGRSLKCQYCSIKDRMPKEKGITPKGYIHLDCIPKYEDEKRFKEKERKELDYLTDVVIELHGLQQKSRIPSSYYPYIQDIRNDTQLFGKYGKKYKKGVDYLTLANTYLFCEEKIKWAKQNKQFKNTMAELKYSLAIVRNNIENYIRDKNKKEKQKFETKEIIKNIKSSRSVNERIKSIQQTPKQKEENETDITTLFD